MGDPAQLVTVGVTVVDVLFVCGMSLRGRSCAVDGEVIEPAHVAEVLPRCTAIGTTRRDPWERGSPREREAQKVF